jgi:uncharacterized protein (TIGR03545 family)
MSADGLPRPFHKPIPEDYYQHRIRDRVFLTNDQAFLDAVTTREDGTVVLSRELTKSEKARLTKIVRQAKKNYGAIRFGKLALLAAIVVLVVVFGLAFRNLLARRAAESALEAVFRARAGVTGVVFRPLAGDFAFESMQVADRNRPMTNLFELGHGRFSVDTVRLLAGRVIIEELTVSELAFGTARDRSGTLPGHPPDDDDDLRLDPLGLVTMHLPDAEDIEALVMEHWERLETPDRVEEIIEESVRFVENREGQIAELRADGVALAQRIEELAATDFGGTRSVDEALRILEQTNTLVRDTTAYTEEVRAAVDATTAEASAIADDVAALPQVMEDDYRRILEELPHIPTDGRELLIGLIEPYLREFLGAWYDRILLGWDYFERVRDPRTTPSSRITGRTGRLIAYPTVDYPTFELSRAFLSTTGERSRELTLGAISSHPVLTGAPARIEYRDEGETVFALDATVDRRPDAEVPMALSVSSAGERLTIDRGLELLGIDRLDGTTDLALSFRRGADGSVSGTVELELSAIEIAGTPDTGTIGELVRDVLAGPTPLHASFAYTVSPDGTIEFPQGATNLDERFIGAARQRVEAAMAPHLAAVREEIDARLEGRLERLNIETDEVTDVQDAALELLSFAADRDAAAAALQQRAMDIVGSLRAEVEGEARERIDAAREAAEDTLRDRLQLPDRLPLPGS